MHMCIYIYMIMYIYTQLCLFVVYVCVCLYVYSCCIPLLLTAVKKSNQYDVGQRAMVPA